MKSLFVSFLLIFLYANSSCAQLWLPTHQKDIPKQEVTVKGTKANNPTIAVAINALERIEWGVPINLQVSPKLSDSKEAYCIKVLPNGHILIEGASEAGILYGAYALIRQKELGLSIETPLEVPAYTMRVLNHWDNLDGTVERGFAGHSIWKWDELPDSISPRYAEYGEACASVGINTVVLNNVNASPKMLSPEYLKKVAAIANILRPYAIRVMLSVNFASPLALGDTNTADPLDPAVIEWWNKKVGEIYQLIPDFAGFLVKANSEGQPGPCDYDRSHAEGANMLADALASYGGQVMWRAFVYKPSSPDRAMQAYEEFMSLDGQFRDNVTIQIKNGPIDFQPREPISSLFGAMSQTREMVEFQITQEYLGAANHAVFLPTLFKEVLDTDAQRGNGTVADITSKPMKGMSAIAGVANIGDSPNWCGHDLAQANWYGFGRLAWNPDISAQQIAEEWLGLTFCTDSAFVQPVSQLMLDSREAAVDYMMPLGLHHIFAGNHHYGPEPWYAPEGLRTDWTPPYYHKADAKGIGFDRTCRTGTGATAQYAKPLHDKYENECPEELLLFFHHVAWDDTLKSGKTLWEELCLHYSKGVEKARQFQKIWDAAEPYVDADRFKAIQSKFKIQTHDAQWWKDACLLYFQEINGLPFPDWMERPVYDLDYLKECQIPLGLFGNPTREMLP